LAVIIDRRGAPPEKKLASDDEQAYACALI
jgi:hypothetical protein